MFLPTLLATLAFAASTASAAPAAPATGPYAIVNNKCDFPVYVTAVGSTQNETEVIYPGHQFYRPEGSGLAIKVTKTEKGLYTSSPVLIFGLTYKAESGLYYDLNTINGFDFGSKKLRIHNVDGLPVEEIVWVGEPKEARTVAYLGGEANLTLELCDTFAQRA